MKKNGFWTLLKGLPYWLYILIGLFFAASLYFLFINSSTAAAPTVEPASQIANTPVVGTLTADEAVVQKLIVNFEVNAHTINVYRSAALRSNFFSGTYLGEWNTYFNSLEGTHNWTIISQSVVNKVRIVSSSSEKIVALACVNDSELTVDQKGKLLKQLPNVSFAGAYVFVRSGTTWKVGNFIDVTDPNKAMSTYLSLPSDLQTLSGPVTSLLNINCG